MTVKEMRPVGQPAGRSRIMRQRGSMPTIAIVDGVKIQMFYNDHTPAHFHAILGGVEVLIAIRGLDVLRGSLPPGKLRHVLEWANEHQGELALNWIRCQDDQPPERI